MTKITTYFLLFFLGFSVSIHAQDVKPSVRVEGRLTNFITGQSLAGISIEVYKNGTLLETKTSSSSGKYKLTDFELDNKYKIVLTGGGMVTRFVEIDLNGIPNEDVFTKGWDVPIDIPLVERLPSIDFSALEPRRTSIIKHNKSTGELDWNMGEIETYRKELEKLLKKIEAEKKKIEEEKAAQEKKYTDAFVAADAAMASKDYQTAINKYKEALAIKPGDKGTIEKLTLAETKYKEFTGAAKLKQEYDDLMKAGDEKLKASEYDNAIASYKAALTKVPNDATANKKINEAEAAKKGSVDKQYNDLLARAEKAFKEKDYGQAKTYYKDAGVIKPSELIPGQKIKEIDEIIKKDSENENKYQTFIANANKAVIGKKFDDAITNFNDALKVRPADAEATRGLVDAKKAKEIADKELNEAANKQKEFDIIVAKADKEYMAKNYAAAVKGYEDALLKFDNPDVRKKKFDAEAAQKKADEELAAKNALLAKKGEYDKFIADGNSAFNSKSFDDALAKYKDALATGINNVEANKKITDTQTAINLAAKADADKIAAEKKKQDFNDLISSGDTKLSSKEFENAIAEYTKALALKVDDPAANKKIADARLSKTAYDKEQADKVLADANAKKKTEFDALITAGNSKLSSKEFDNSIAEYKKALLLKVDDATANAKIKEANDAKTAFDLAQKDAAAKELAAKKKAEFDAIITAGNTKLSSKEFDNSILEYKKALFLKVDDATANAKIKEATDAKIAFDLEQKDAAAKELAAKKKAEFDAIITAGNTKLSAKEFDNSILEYKKALLLKVDDATANAKIKEATDAKTAFDLEQKDSAAKELATKKKAEFDAHITAGNTKLTAKDFTNAIAEYNKALILKVDDATANAKIKEANDAKIAFDLEQKDSAAKELAAKKKAEFDAHISAGDSKLSAKDFANSILEYNKALVMKVDDATANAKIKEATEAKIAFEKEKLAQADAAGKKKLYDDVIAKAQKHFDAGEFTTAIVEYNTALTYVPNDPFAKGQIDKANIEIEKKKKFAAEQLQKILDQADKDYDAKNYADAKGYYERYLKERPTDAHSIERIKDIDLKIKDGVAHEKVEAAYKEFMSKADAALGAKKYDDAIALYTGALGVKVGDADATTKKEQAIKAKADSANAVLMAANKKKYDDIIKKASAFFDSGEFTSAITEYNNALAVIPADAYATAQIEKANQKINEKKDFAEKELQKILEQADKDFTAENYTDAKGYYERYIKQRPTDAHSIGRIKECEAKIKAFESDAAAKLKRETAYKGFMVKGEAALKVNKFDEAILDFDAALGVIPADATATEKKALAQKMKEDMSNSASAAVLKKRYDVFIVKANNLFDAGDFTHSITEYNNALGVIPGDDFATKRIALANQRIDDKKKEVETMLEKLLTAANNEFKDGNWTDAKGYYERYIKIRPDHTYSQDQIKLCDAKIKEELANTSNKATIEARYKKFMEEGETLAGLKKYDEAIMKFTGALNTKPGDGPAQTRIDAMNKMKNDLFNQAKANAGAKENQARYDAAIGLGNTELSEGDFDPAIVAFKDALNYKPLDKYATDQIKRCMKLRQEKIDAGLAMYTQIIAKADQLFDGRSFQDAKDLYERAQKFNNSDPYPPKRILECDNMLAKLNKKEGFELVHSGKIVTGSTVLDGQRMIEEAKRQEKYQAEQNYVAIYDNNVKYHEGKGTEDDQEALRRQDTYNSSSFNREQEFKGKDEMRLAKVDSTIEYIDVRDATYRGALHAQDQSNLVRQDNFNQYEYNTEQMFKGKDAMRVYKVDSVKFEQEKRNDYYYQNLKNSDHANYIKQGNFNEKEFYTEQLYKSKDEMRQFKADSIAFHIGQRENYYRQNIKNSDQANYIKQGNFNEFEVYTEQLYKSKDAMRIYLVDSIKFNQERRNDYYYQNSKNSDQANYVKQGNYNEAEYYNEQLLKSKDEMRVYKADSIKLEKDLKDQQYRETQKDQSTKNYNKQLDYNQNEFDTEQLLKQKDGIRQESVSDVKENEVVRDAFVADVKTKNGNATSTNNNEFITGEETRDAFAKEKSKNYLDGASDLTIKKDVQTSTIDEFKKDGDQSTNANNEKFKTTNPVIPQNYDNGHLTRVASEYGPGIHQWTTHKSNGNNVVYEINTRRIVIKSNTANDYMMTVNKWGTSYTKNGKTIGDYVWQVETGGDIIEHDK